MGWYRLTFIWGILTVGLALFGFAQNTQDVEDAEESEPDAMTAPPAGLTLPSALPAPLTGLPLTNAAVGQAGPAVTNAAEMLIGLKYENMDLDEILKQYSDWTGLAIMKAPDVPAVKITLKCPKRLPKREALMAIEGVLAMNGVGLVPMGDKFLKVVQIAAARQSGMATGTGALDKDIAETDHLVSRIVDLKHIDTTEAQGIIQNFLHSYGKALPLERVNCVMITDTAVNIKRILEILEVIDQPIETREELRIFPIRYAKASEIQSKIESIIADSQARDSRTRLIRQQLSTARMPMQPLQPSQPTFGPSTVDISASERGLIQGKVKMVADDRTNGLIIICRPEQFPFFENIIKALDRQVEPDVTIKVFRLEYANAKDVVSVLNSLIGSKQQTPSATPPLGPSPTPATPAPKQEPTKTTGSTTTSAGEIQLSGKLSADVKIIADTRINALLIMASKEDMTVIENVLMQVDIMLSQVLIEVVIIEITLDNTVKTGIDWLQRSMIAYNKKQGGGRRAFLGFAGASRAGTDGKIRDATQLTSVNDDITTAGSGLTYYLTMFDWNIDAVINMLETTSRARILSTPIILTTDNKEAKVSVGEKRPIVTSTSFSSGGVQQSAYEYKDIGIELKVTPRINKRGFVVMEVLQTIDNVGGKVLIDGNEVPIITSRDFGAAIAVDDRRTIVLGGLVGKDTTKGRSGIPILSDIPLLGLLFRSDTTEDRRVELLVLITPYVLDTPDKVYQETQRRHGALDEGRHFYPKGWSESEIATTPEEEKAIKKQREKDLQEKKSSPKSKSDGASKPAAATGDVTVIAIPPQPRN